MADWVQQWLVRVGVDWADLLVFLGLACLAGAVWMALGLVGVLCFVGGVLFVLGLALQ